MGISIFKTNPTGTEQINIEEAYNIWNLLNARYNSFQTVQMFNNFVHDRDFQVLLNSLIKLFINEIKVLEKEAIKFSLKVPTRPAIGIESSLKINELTDKFLYFRIITDMLSELFSLSRTVRTTLTSDRLRKQFTEFFVSHFEHYGDLNSFGKLKGWEEVTPGFKTPKTKQNEQLSVSEAFHIFDHIRQRYDQIELTLFYESFVHDIDFKASMAIGIRTLKKQVKKLEEVAQTHGLMLPERPPISMKVPIDPESIEDRFMYRQIFTGVDNMLDAHIRAIIETKRNDNLRKLFIALFKDEIGTHDSMIKYGKLKGWLVLPPVYSPGTSG